MMKESANEKGGQVDGRKFGKGVKVGIKENRIGRKENNNLAKGKKEKENSGRSMERMKKEQEMKERR